MRNFVRRNKEYIRCNLAFSCANWTKCFGEKAISDEDRKIERETLPDNIREILNSECPAFPGKKVSETHILVFIPKTINGKLLTINNLGKLAKKYFPKNEDGYKSIWSSMANAIGNHSIENAGWVLMTKDILEGSRGKRFNEQSPGQGPTQKQCVAELAEKAGFDYVVPPALLAATCILSQFFKDSHTRLFRDDPSTFTQCQDSVNTCQVVIGDFAASGLHICIEISGNNFIGVAALRKF